VSGSGTSLEGQGVLLLASAGDVRGVRPLVTAFATAYLVMLCGAVYALFITTSPAGHMVEKAGSSSGYTMLWLALYAMLAFTLRHELIRPINLIARNRLFALFLFSALLSYAFSPPATELVATKLFMFVMTLLFGLFLARNFTIERFVRLFVVLSACVLIVHWLIYPIQSHFGYDNLDRETLLGIAPYGGLFAHKNLAGTFFGLAFLASWGRAMQPGRRLRYMALAAGHAAALVVAGAASALLCAMLAALIMAGISLFARRSRFAPLLLLTIALAAVFVMYAGTSSLLHAVGRDAGMTGRWRVFDVWPDYFWQHPMFGWGYSNFFTGEWNEPAEALRTLTPYHARYFTFESGYLELLIDFGLVGAGLFFAMMTAGFRNALRAAWHADVPFGLVPMGWLTFIAVMSVSDSGLRIHNLITAAIVAWTYFGLREGLPPNAQVFITEAKLVRQPWRPSWTPS